MNKLILSLLVVLLSIVGLVACGGQRKLSGGSTSYVSKMGDFQEGIWDKVCADEQEDEACKSCCGKNNYAEYSLWTGPEPIDVEKPYICYCWNVPEESPFDLSTLTPREIENLIKQSGSDLASTSSS